MQGCFNFSTETNAQTGNVGIGTTTLSEKLEVKGNFRDSTFSTTWTASISYDSNYVVLYEGNFYKHLTTTNTATTPDIDDTNWGSISSEATTAEYLHAKISEEETIDSGDPITKFNTLTSIGGLSVSATGRVTLNAGVTYKLQGVLNASNSSPSYTSAIYTWYDETNAANLGNLAFFYPANRDVLGSDQPTAVAYITPSTAISVYLKATTVNGTTTTTDADYGYITVEAVANRLPVTQDMSSNTDVDQTPHTQQATIADGAALRYNSSTGKWEADVVEGFADDDIAFTTPWGFELKMNQVERQGYIRNASGITKFFSKQSAGYSRVSDQVGSAGINSAQAPSMSNGWITVWGNTSLILNDFGDYEFMRFIWADSVSEMAAGNYEEYEVTLVVGGGYDNNYFRVKKLK